MSYGLAVAESPGYMEAHCNRGNVFHQLEKWEQALECFDVALGISPNDAFLHSNRGVVLKELGRLDESLASFDRAVALRPDHAAARFNRGTLLLARGELTHGFADYEWRWEDKSGSVYKERRTFSAPRWQGGESLQDKTVLLYAEQGYGDTLQFCRYAPLVAGLGAHVMLEVHAPLVTLLADLPGLTRLIPRGAPLPHVDFQLPLMSAPLALGTTLDTIPLADRYLTSDPSKVEEWQARLGRKTAPRVGLAWSGNAAHVNDRRRSISLGQLLAALPAGFEYVSLQRDVRERDRAVMQAHPEVLTLADDTHDFSDLAALCMCMDLVISVDTSVAHLAGALGLATWILLPSHPDWRWLLQRSDSPWYSSVTLYRQAERGEWQTALQRIAADLRHRDWS